MNGVVVYVCNAEFPTGSAYSSRVLNFCRLFKDLDYKPIVVSDYADRTFSSLDSSQYQSFESISFITIGNQSFNYRYFKRKKVVIKAISSILSASAGIPVFIIVAERDFPIYNRIKKEFEDKATLILEACEWYDVSSYKFSYLDPRYIMFSKYMKHIYPNCNNVIAISSFLENYFSKKNSLYGKNIIRIPTILDTKKHVFSLSSQTNSNRIVLMFAGSYSGNGKEDFKELFLALSQYNEKCPFVLKIYGISKQDYLSISKANEKQSHVIDNCVQFMGKLSQKEIYIEYTKADYSVIIRPDRRSSNAGFPTKLAESLSAGTPVIANLTGDLGMYIVNGENGFIIEKTASDIKRCLDQIVSLTLEQKERMREKARKTAELCFDYRIYENEMGSFLRIANGGNNDK